MRNHVFFSNGERYDIPSDRVSEFEQSATANKMAYERGQRFRTESGEEYDIPESEVAGFLKASPKATRLVPFSIDGMNEEYIPVDDLSRRVKEVSPGAKERTQRITDMDNPLRDETLSWLEVGKDAWLGANVGANKIAMAIPEVAGGLTEALGHTANLFGAAKNPVGDYLVQSGRNFAPNLKQYGEKIGLDLNEDLETAVGYEDQILKFGNKATDVTKMAIKFAPAMATGGGAAFANAVFSGDAINAGMNVREAALENGHSEAEAYEAAAAAGLITYFGAKALPKAGALGGDLKSPILKFLSGLAGTSAAMGAQSAGMKGVENLATNQSLTEGMGTAAVEGAGEGALFHGINALPTALHAAYKSGEAKRQEKEFVRRSLLDACENENGAALVNVLASGKGLEDAVSARGQGMDVSRSMAKKMGLPDNMTVAERNRVVDSVIESRKAAEARAKAEAEAAEAAKKEAAEQERVAKEREITARRQQEIAEQKRQTEEYDRAERERIERERAEQEAAPTMNEERNRDYHDWLKKQGRKDTDKNFRKWLGQNEIENVSAEDAEMIRGKGVIEAERAEGEAKEAAKRKAETVDALQRMVGERESAEADAIARDKWEREQSRRADLDRRAEERGQAERDSWEANEVAREQFERHEARQNDIETAFKDYDAALAAAKAKQKQGKRVETPKAPEEIAEAVKDDAQLQELDRKYRSAQTADERKEIEQEFAARVTELRQGMERKAAWQKENDQRAADRAGAEAASWEADAKARAEWDAKHKDAPTSAEPSAPAPAPAAPTRGKAKRTPAKPAQETKPTAAKAEKPSASRGAPDAEQISNFRAQIAEAKKANKDGSGSGKVFSAKVGPTSMTFAVSDDGIAAAERMLKRIENPKKWGKPSETRSVPEPPIATKVAKEPPSDTNEVLKPFVDTKKKGIDEPFSDGKFDYATDSYSIIRVKSKSGEKRGDQSLAQKASGLFEGEPIDGVDAKTTTTELEIACEQAKNVLNKYAKARYAKARKIKGRREPYISETATTREDNLAVELWRTKDGKVAVRARSGYDVKGKELGPIDVNGQADAAFFNGGKSLDGAKLLCRVNSERLKDVCSAFAKMGEGEVSLSVVSDGLLLLKGKNVDAAIQSLIEMRSEAGKEIRAYETSAKAHDPLWSKSPDAEMSERVDLRRLDPKRRSDPKVLDWAKKKGRTISDGKVTPDAVREYDAQMAKGAAKAARRWFPDMNITYHDYGENIKRGQHDIVLRDTSGRALGWFEPGTKNVHLLPGANAETVAHEIMWHGTRDWATKRAAAGDARAQKLLDMMHDVEKNAPEDLKNTVRRLYRKDYKGDADLLHNEFGAWLTMGKGGRALEAAMAKAENRTWYAKAFNAVKELFKDFLTKHGKNRIDLSKIDGMGRDEFVDFLASEFAGGKTLGKIGTKSGPTGELSTKETVVQKLRRKVYDINAAVRDLQRDIEKQTGKKLSDAEDVEAANALTPGLREAAVMNVRSKLAGYRDLLHKTGISDADAQYYMALKAAAGRDAKVDAKNLAKLDAKAEKDVRAEWGSEKIAADKDGFKAAVEQRKAEYRESYESTNGSHISPAEAKRMLAELEGGEHAEGYSEIRDYLRDVMDETLDAQVKAGLISKEVAAKYRAEEPDYIPFKNEFDETTGEFGGRGNMMNLGRPEHYEAKGRSSSAGDITAHIFGDFQSSLLRGIETNVRQKLANLVKAHPEIGTIEKLSETNRLREKVKSDRKDKGNITGDPNLVLFKQDGDTYAIHLNGERGSAIAAAMTERNATKWDGWYPKFARWSAAAATRWSPTFSVRNFTKDNIELSNIVFSEKGAVGGAKWIGNYLKSQKDMAGTLAKYITTGKIDATTEQGKMLKSYIDNGGLISGGATEGYDAIKRSFTPEAIAKEMKKGDSRAKAIAKHTLKAITYLNEFAEMTTRVNAYVAELKSGATEQQAALFSRRATVDFNRKGENTGVTNIVRLFSNSTLGAQARAVSALVRGKYGRRVALALFANGFAQSLLEHYMNAEEDKKREKTGEATGKDMSEFERKTSLFYVRNGDNVYRVPQHESPFSLIGYAGNCVGRFVLGDLGGKDLAKNLGVSALETAFPFTGLGSINLTSREGGIGEDAKAAIISGFCPSALQPLAEMLVGMDYKGDLLYKRNYSVTTPNSEVSKTHTPEYAKTAAAWMNEATGGNEARKGYVDVHPEAVQKFVEGFGKNAARDVMQGYEVGKAILTGDLKSLTPRDIPVKRDFVRPLDGNTARFYEAYNDFKADKDEFKKRKDWTPEEKREFRKAHPWVDATRGLQIDKVVDRKNTQTPRSGFRDMGINQLRKFCDGWVLRKDGSYVKPKKPVSDAEKEAAKKELLRKQALVVKRMGK